MDEEQLGLRQELEEAQNASTAVEEELVDNSSWRFIQDPWLNPSGQVGISLSRESRD